jgi:pyrophosphatase PpaX
MPKGLSLSCYKAVLFDVDGTLVDSLSMLIRGLGDTYERYSDRRPSDEEIKSLIGLPLKEQLKLFRSEPPGPELLDEMIGYAIDRFDAHQELESVFGSALEALRLCHNAGLRTALVTSKSYAELAPFLNRFPGTAYVQTSVCATDVIQPKPHPEAATLACHRLDVLPSETIFIGDSAFDMRCGREAGCATIAVAYGSGDRGALEREQPDLIIDTPQQLLDWVSQSLLTTSCQERK